MKTIEILKQLVAIPSWVDEKTNEIKIGNWIMDFLSKNTKLEIIKQEIKKGRFNIIASNSNKIDVLLTGHMDNVDQRSNQSGNSWKQALRLGDNRYEIRIGDYALPSNTVKFKKKHRFFILL